MKSFNNKIIIGIDHGYGNIKTANHCFPTGITAHDSEPLFTKDMLTYNGKYYLIGEGHKEFLPEKQNDEDYYILTLAAIATELTDEGLTEADIIFAAGLPLTWTSGQKADFAAYLSKNKEVEFTFRNVDYHIRISDVKIYPQGYSAVVPINSTLKGLSMVLCLWSTALGFLGKRLYSLKGFSVNDRLVNIHKNRPFFRRIITAHLVLERLFIRLEIDNIAAILLLG